MATTTEVKKALDDIATIIVTERQAYANAKARIQAASANLNAITTQYAGVITEIDGYTPTGAFETLAQDEKAKLAAEFAALRSTINGLIGTAEFSA
jgi:hypothetical protein